MGERGWGGGGFDLFGAGCGGEDVDRIRYVDVDCLGGVNVDLLETGFAM